MQITDGQRQRNPLTVALDLDLDCPSYRTIQRSLQGHKRSDGLPSQAHEDVAGTQHTIPGTSREDLIHHQHAVGGREHFSNPGLRVGLKPTPAHLIKGQVLEGGLEGSPADRLFLLEERQRPDHAIQGQEVAGSRRATAARIEGEHIAINVDDR